MIAGHFGFAAMVKSRERTAPLWALMLANGLAGHCVRSTSGRARRIGPIAAHASSLRWSHHLRRFDALVAWDAGAFRIAGPLLSAEMRNKGRHRDWASRCITWGPRPFGASA
jgi:hypothetical protein